MNFEISFPFLYFYCSHSSFFLLKILPAPPDLYGVSVFGIKIYERHYIPVSQYILTILPDLISV